MESGTKLAVSDAVMTGSAIAAHALPQASAAPALQHGER